jgi:hypothetical protein
MTQTRCGCGCARPSMSAVRASRSRFSRRRRMGDAFSDAEDQGFQAGESYVAEGTGVDVQGYVGDAAADAATAQKVYQAAQAAVTALQQPDNYQATKDAMLATEALAAYLSNAVGLPMLGAAFDAWFSQQPIAGEGPGVCGTDPPKDFTWQTLQAWPHYVSWASQFGAYQVPAPGSFEEFANLPLEYNRALMTNCFAQKSVAPMPMLAHLIANWNANHASTVQRTITRTGLNPTGFNVPPSYDPIAMALEDSILYPPGYTGTVASPNQQYNATRKFVINDGPQIAVAPHVVTLRLLPGHPLTTTSAKAPSSSSSSSAAATVAVLGAAGAATFYVHTVGIAGLPRWLRALFG